MKIILSEMKNTLDWINNQLDISEEKMHELNDIAMETTQNKIQRVNRIKGK